MTTPLRCLHGRPAPPEISGDLALLAALPVAARRTLYRVLGPFLREPAPADVEARIEQFCAELDVELAVVQRALRASRFLLRNAAQLNLSDAELAEDLGRLGDAGEAREALLPGYDLVKQVVRGEAAVGSLADHGKVVERVAWRVDRVATSNRGAGLDVPVAVLTLWYAEEGRRERVTLQLAPDAVAELRALCESLP